MEGGSSKCSIDKVLKKYGLFDEILMILVGVAVSVVI